VLQASIHGSGIFYVGISGGLPVISRQRQNWLSANDASDSRVGRRHAVMTGRSASAMVFVAVFVIAVAASPFQNIVLTRSRGMRRPAQISASRVTVKERLAFTREVNLIFLVVGLGRIVDLSGTGFKAAIFVRPLMIGLFHLGVFAVGGEADETANDDDDDTDADHQTDVLQRQLAFLVFRVRFEEWSRATLRGLTAGRTHVSRGTNHFRCA